MYCEMIANAKGFYAYSNEFNTARGDKDVYVLGLSKYWIDFFAIELHCVRFKFPSRIICKVFQAL